MRTDQTKDHFVPAFLLEHFRGGPGGEIHVYDKWTDATFSSGPRGIGAERGYYHFQIADRPATAEPFLKELDTAASAVIKSVVDKQILPSSDHERFILAAFVAAQFLRVEDMRNSIRSQQAQISEWLTSLGEDPSEVRGFDVLSEDELRAASILHLGDLKDYVPGFLKKLWILLRTTDAMPFYISDTPVTLRNDRDFGALSGLGLEVPGIEIHLPLSKTLTLGLLCSSHLTLFESAGREEHVLRGVPLDIPERMVMSLNELQVMFSSRFVYSCNGDFHLVIDVISQRPHLKNGMRRKGRSQQESGHVRK